MGAVSSPLLRGSSPPEDHDTSDGPQPNARGGGKHGNTAADGRRVMGHRVSHARGSAAMDASRPRTSVVSSTPSARPCSGSRRSTISGEARALTSGGRPAVLGFARPASIGAGSRSDGQFVSSATTVRLAPPTPDRRSGRWRPSLTRPDPACSLPAVSPRALNGSRRQTRPTRTLSCCAGSPSRETPRPPHPRPDLNRDALRPLSSRTASGARRHRRRRHHPAVWERPLPARTDFIREPARLAARGTVPPEEPTKER
jgi:hypothetical protein